jgi:hypothetical protein
MVELTDVLLDMGESAKFNHRPKGWTLETGRRSAPSCMESAAFIGRCRVFDLLCHHEICTMCVCPIAF